MAQPSCSSDMMLSALDFAGLRASHVIGALGAHSPSTVGLKSHKGRFTAGHLASFKRKTHRKGTAITLPIVKIDMSQRPQTEPRLPEPKAHRGLGNHVLADGGMEYELQGLGLLRQALSPATHS